MLPIRIRRGLSADRLNYTPANGELIVTTDTKEKIPYTLEVSIIEESDTRYKIKIDDIKFNSSDHFKHKKTIIDMDNNRWILKKDVELIVESKAVVRKDKMSKLLEDDKE